MKHDPPPNIGDSHRRLEDAYKSEKPRLMAHLRAVGRSLEEAEDLIHDVYAETMERFSLIVGIRNLPAETAWMNWRDVTTFPSG